MGAHHHELHGHIAFAAWLGVHAWLMSGVRQRVDAFVSWGWDFLGSSRSSSIIEDPDTAQIDWGDDRARNLVTDPNSAGRNRLTTTSRHPGRC